jgi:Ribbon-helix-helix domain
VGETDPWWEYGVSYNICQCDCDYRAGAAKFKFVMATKSLHPRERVQARVSFPRKREPRPYMTLLFAQGPRTPGQNLAGTRLACYTPKHIAAFLENHMPTDTTTRWTVSVSKDTDIVVRSFLAQRGLKKGDLSKFIEEAVRWRVLDRTMAEARSKFADMTPEALETVIDAAITAARKAGGRRRR